MHDLADIADWLQTHAIHHETPVHDTLPDPVFRVNGQDAVSFSTNNYLALANHPRLVSAAKAGLERYGVGNCESRLLGGDLPVYRELERRLGALKHKTDAVLFVTGYMTNIGVLSTLVKVGLTTRTRPASWATTAAARRSTMAATAPRSCRWGRCPRRWAPSAASWRWSARWPTCCA